MWLISLILTILYVIWLSRLISFGVRTATRIADASEASAASLAVLVEALNPEAQQRVIDGRAAAAKAQIDAANARTEAAAAAAAASFPFRMVILGTIIAVLVGIVLWNYSAHADDHMIRPTCWEENHNGVVERHCEVIRPGQSHSTPIPPTAQQPAPTPEPQQAELPPPPPSYPSPRSAPFRSELVDGPGGRVFLGAPPSYYRPPVAGGYYVGPQYYPPPPQPYYAPPPFFAFGFGPFTFVVP
jgi:hypothetical protein